MKQVRFISSVDCGLQIREPQEGDQPSRLVVGKPIVFGVRSVNLTPWSDTRKVYEVLEPGCITNELLQRSDVVLNINHSSKVTDVLGRCNNGNGTLSLTLRESSVESECELPMTNAANDTLELIRRGDISGMSFAFEDDWEDSENGVSYERTNEVEDGKEVWLRHVKRIRRLFDVSIVTHPAYEQTTVGTREQNDIDEAIEAQLQREQKQPAQTSEETTEEEAEAKAEERELEEQEQRFREQQAMRLRYQARRINDDILESLNY